MVLAATSETRARVGFDESPESTIMTEAKPRRLAWASRGAVVLLLAAACSSSSNADDDESNPDACVSGAAKVVGALMHCDGGACVPVDAEHFATTNTGNSLHCDWTADRQKLACKCDFDPGCDGPPLRLSRTTRLTKPRCWISGERTARVPATPAAASARTSTRPSTSAGPARPPTPLRTKPMKTNPGNSLVLARHRHVAPRAASKSSNG
jgi:hypothetical protein